MDWELRRHLGGRRSRVGRAQLREAGQGLWQDPGRSRQTTTGWCSSGAVSFPMPPALAGAGGTTEPFTTC